MLDHLASTHLIQSHLADGTLHNPIEMGATTVACLDLLLPVHLSLHFTLNVQVQGLGHSGAEAQEFIDCQAPFTYLVSLSLLASLLESFRYGLVSRRLSPPSSG